MQPFKYTFGSYGGQGRGGLPLPVRGPQAIVAVGKHGANES